MTDIAAFLQEALGQKLVAYMVGRHVDRRLVREGVLGHDAENRRLAVRAMRRADLRPTSVGSAGPGDASRAGAAGLESESPKAHDLRIKQEEAAYRAGVHPVEFARAERGVRDLRVSTIAKIARGLDVPASDLLRDV